MCTDQFIDLDYIVDKHATSFICQNLAKIGMQRFVEAWNNHQVTGIKIL